MKASLRIVSVLSTMFVLTVATAKAQSVDLVGQLPDTSLVVVSWAGQNQAMDESMFGQMLNDPKCKSLVSVIQKAFEQNITDDEKKLTFVSAWSLSKTLITHPCAFAMTDLSVKEDEKVKPSLVLLIDPGKDRQAFDKAVENLLSRVPAEEIKEEQLGRMKYKTIEVDEDVVCLGYLDSTFFICLGKDVPGKLANAATALTRNKKYADAMKAVTGPDQQATYYVDIEGILNKIGPMPASAPASKPAADQSAGHWRKVVADLGLGKVSVLAGTTRIVDKGLYTRCKLFTPAPHQGVLMLLAGGELAETDLANVPADADFVMAWKASPAAIMKELRRIVPKIDGDANTIMIAGLGAAQMALGLTFEKDIFAHMGNTWVLSSAASQGGDWTGTVLTVSVKDAAKLQASLTTVEQKVAQLITSHIGNTVGQSPLEFAGLTNDSRISIESVKQDSADIHYALVAGLPFPLAPAWTINNDRLYIAGWPQVIQTTLQNKTKPLIETEMYRKVRSKVAAKPACLSYINTPQQVRKAYNLALIFWTMGANLGSGVVKDAAFKPDWLPALTSIEKYIWPEVHAISFDNDGIIFESYCSIPMASMITPAIAVPMIPTMITAALYSNAYSRNAINVQPIMTPEEITVEEDEGGGADAPLPTNN